MRISAVAGITPVSMRSVADTERGVVDLMVRVRGPESAHDPGVTMAARDAAEMAHGNGAGLVAVVQAANADPAILVGMVVQTDGQFGADTTDTAAQLRQYLSDTGGADIREVTEARTERGYPVVIAERILVDGPSRSAPPAGCQLQAVVLDPTCRRTAVFTLHSTTGRGWLELATTLGHLLSTVDFEATFRFGESYGIGRESYGIDAELDDIGQSGVESSPHSSSP